MFTPKALSSPTKRRFNNPYINSQQQGKDASSLRTQTKLLSNNEHSVAETKASQVRPSYAQQVGNGYINTKNYGANSSPRPTLQSNAAVGSGALATICGQNAALTSAVAPHPPPPYRLNNDDHVFYKFPQPEDGPNNYLSDLGIPHIPLPSEQFGRHHTNWCNRERERLGLIPPQCSYYTRLFIGGGNSHMTAIQLKWIIEFVTGAYDVKVVGNAPVGKDVFYVDVHPWDAPRVIRELSKRVILDEKGFYIWRTSREQTICALYAQTIAMGERVHDNDKNIDNWHDVFFKRNDGVVCVRDGKTPLLIRDKNNNLNSFQFPDHHNPAQRTNFTAPMLNAIRARRVRCRPRSFLTVNLCNRENENAVDRFCPCDYCRRFFAGTYDPQFCFPPNVPSNNNNTVVLPPKPDDYDSRVMAFQENTFWPEFYNSWVEWDLGIPLHEQEDPYSPTRVHMLKSDYTTMPCHANQLFSSQLDFVVDFQAVANQHFPYHGYTYYPIESPNPMSPWTRFISKARLDADEGTEHFYNFITNHNTRRIRKSDWSEIQLGTLKTTCKVNTSKLFNEYLPGMFSEENINYFDINHGIRFDYTGCHSYKTNTNNHQDFPRIYY